MLTIACVLKSGGIYEATWVARLRDGVARHLPVEHRFVCLSDVDVPCERIPLVHGWPGWWSKIELFKLQGPVLYFDLDTAIVGDLGDMAHAASAHEIVALRDFYRLGDGIGSGVLAWRDDVAAIYRRFAMHPEAHMLRLGSRGDQGFLEGYDGVTRWQDIVSGIVSYKVHCRNGIPPDARVVCLHGRPKFGDMPVNDPVRQAWEMAA
jgi:hypothetical protein